MISTVSFALAAIFALDNASMLDKVRQAASGENDGAPPPASGSDVDFFTAALQMAGALALVLALLLAIAWAVKRWAPGAVARISKDDRIDILGVRQIGMRRSLILAKVKGRVVFLGATPQQINPLSEWAANEEQDGEAVDSKERRASAIGEFQTLLDEHVRKEKEKSP